MNREILSTGEGAGASAVTGRREGTLGGRKQGAFVTASVSSVKFIPAQDLGETAWNSKKRPKKGKEYVKAGIRTFLKGGSASEVTGHQAQTIHDICLLSSTQEQAENWVSSG